MDDAINDFASQIAESSKKADLGIDNVIQCVAAGKESRETLISIGLLNSEPSPPWTVVEREKLLTGLREFGPLDVSKLQKRVGTRSVNEVLMFLKEMKCRSESEIVENRSEKAPIEHWLNMVDLLLDDHPDYTTEIERVLIKLASKLREDPMHNRFNYTTMNGALVDVEYSRILTHLSCLIKGCAVNQLSLMESFILIELLQRTADYLKTLDLTEAEKHLLSLSQAFTSGKLLVNHDYDLSLDVAADKGEAIFDKSFNPFNIPPEIIEPKPIARGSSSADDSILEINIC